MKQIILGLTLMLMLWSCNNQGIDNSTSSPNDTGANESIEHVEKNTLLAEKKATINDRKNQTTQDSIIQLSDSLFSDLALDLKVISANEFRIFKTKYKPTCNLDTNGFISGKDLVFVQHNERKSPSYLIDKKTSTKLTLPSSYDQGIIGLTISPSCNQFLVYSAYDGPGFATYYDYRAEVFGFTLSNGKGLETVKPTFRFSTKDWSIEEVIWMNDNSLALKTYVGDRASNEQNKPIYKYFRARLYK